jgi:hypothetical protein
MILTVFALRRPTRMTRWSRFTAWRTQFEFILRKGAIAIGVERSQGGNGRTQFLGAYGTITVHVQGFGQTCGRGWRRRRMVSSRPFLFMEVDKLRVTIGPGRAIPLFDQLRPRCPGPQRASQRARTETREPHTSVIHDAFSLSCQYPANERHPTDTGEFSEPNLKPR